MLHKVIAHQLSVDEEEIGRLLEGRLATAEALAVRLLTGGCSRC